MFPPPISISLRSGFLRERLVWWGWSAVIRRMKLVVSSCSVSFLSIFSVSGFSGSLILRWSSLGGSFIHASVSWSSPYGVFVYVRMPQMRMGGVSMIVAARMTSLPKFGDRFRSSMVKTYVMPALNPVKPRSLGVGDWVCGQ